MSEEEKLAFLSKLPARVAAIDENWRELRSGTWDPKRLETLYSRVRELSDGSNTYDLYQLSEAVFSLEVYLSSFIDIDQRPTEGQLEEIDGLLRALQTACLEVKNAQTQQSNSDTTDTDPHLEIGHLVYAFHRYDSPAADVASNLRARGCQIETFTDGDALVGALGGQVPVAILADTAQLAQMAAVSGELRQLKQQRAIQVPVVFVSNSNSLEMRVDAMRAGADAYFVEPFKPDEVANRLLELSNPEPSAPYRILVVEDDPTQAEFAASILRKEGMEVETVIEPLKVMDVLGGFKPDLILMDIYMPNVNGLELTTVIRDHSEFIATPIIFLSGEQDTNKQIDALSVGGDDFITKPIRARHLLSVVSFRIRRSRSMQAALSGMRTHDSQTGLFSKRVFMDRIAKALDRHEPHTQVLALVTLTPDNAPELREAIGIGGVDNLMASLGNELMSRIDPSDSASKLDDNTVAALIRRQDRDAIKAWSESLREVLAERAAAVVGPFVNASFSAGICVARIEMDDPGSLVGCSAKACAAAQSNGGDQIQIFDAVNGEGPAPEEDPLTMGLRSALVRDEFVVLYQPLLDLQTRGAECYEVMLRLRSSGGELLTERELRRPASDANLLADLDRWLAKKAIGVLKDQGRPERNLRLLVRQSGATVADPEMAAWLREQLRKAQFGGTGLILDYRLPDVTEDIKGVRDNVRALRELGIGVCISRFLESTAAFKILRYLQADYVSIAPRLLTAKRDVISKFIAQAHKLDAKVVVPNVNDPRSIDLHWSSGADLLQGAFIQQPMTTMDYDFSQIVL